MRLISGKVIDGKIELEGERLKEGASVTVLALDDEEPFELSEDDQRELRTRITEMERGHHIDGEALLDELSK